MPLDDWTRDVATGAVGTPWMIVEDPNFARVARHPGYSQPFDNGGESRQIRVDESLNPFAYPLIIGLTTFGAFLPDPFYKDQRFDNRDDGDLFLTSVSIGGRSATVADNWRRSGQISDGRLIPANRVLGLYTSDAPRYLSSTDSRVDLTDAYQTRSVELRIVKASSVSWLMLWMPLSHGSFSLTGVCLRARPIVPVIRADSVPSDAGVAALTKLEVLTIVDGAETSRGSLVVGSRNFYVDVAQCRSAVSLTAPDQIVVSVAAGGTVSSLRFADAITNPDATICGSLDPSADAFGNNSWAVQALNYTAVAAVTTPIDHGQLVHVAHFGGAAATVPYPSDYVADVNGLPQSTEWATYAFSQYPYSFHAGHRATLEGVQLRTFSEIPTTPVYDLREHAAYTNPGVGYLPGSMERYPVREAHAASAMLQTTALSVVHGRTQTADRVAADDGDRALRIGTKRITGVTLFFTPYEKSNWGYYKPTLDWPLYGSHEQAPSVSGSAEWIADAYQYVDNRPAWVNVDGNWWIDGMLFQTQQFASQESGSILSGTFKDLLYGQILLVRGTRLGYPNASNDLTGLGITKFPALPPGELRSEYALTRLSGDANNIFSCATTADLSKTLAYNRYAKLQVAGDNTFYAVPVPVTEAWSLTCNVDMRCALGVRLQEYGTFSPGPGSNAVYDAHVQPDNPRGRFRDTIAYVDGKAPRPALNLTLNVRLPLSGTLDVTVDTSQLPGNYPFHVDANRTTFVATESAASGVSDWFHQFSADDTQTLLAGQSVDLLTWQTYGETDKYRYLDCGGVGRRYRVRCSLTTTAVVD